MALMSNCSNKLQYTQTHIFRISILQLKLVLLVRKKNTKKRERRIERKGKRNKKVVKLHAQKDQMFLQLKVGSDRNAAFYKGDLDGRTRFPGCKT